MNSSKPYLLRAIFEWLVDNQVTPHLLVNTLIEGVRVPEQYIENNQIVLNVSPQAVQGLALENSQVSFQARFSGTPWSIYLPMDSILAIYAKENGQGMAFSPQEVTTNPNQEEDKVSSENKVPTEEEGKKKGKPSHLKIIK